jgi:hypothetical protein
MVVLMVEMKADLKARMSADWTAVKMVVQMAELLVGQTAD